MSKIVLDSSLMWLYYEIIGVKIFGIVTNDGGGNKKFEIIYIEVSLNWVDYLKEIEYIF